MIERHIEKAILGVFILLLLFAIGRWGVSSPLSVEVITDGRGTMETLPPGQADAKILEAARDIVAERERQTPEPVASVDFTSAVERLQQSPFRPVRLMSWGPVDAPLAEREMDAVPFPTLAGIKAALPTPTKPLVRVELELPKREGVQAEDVIAAHVASTFAWKELEKAWIDELAATSLPADIIVVAVEAEVRKRLPGGSWGEPRPVKSVRLPVVDRSGYELLPPALQDYDGSNEDEIRQSVRELVDQWQSAILHPSYWEILYAGQDYGPWQKHLADNPVSAKAPEQDLQRSPSRKTVRSIPDMMMDPKGGGFDPMMAKMGPPAGMGKAPMRVSKAPSRGEFGKSGGMPPGGMGGKDSGRSSRVSRRAPARAARTVRRSQPTAAYVKEVEQAKITPVPPLQQQIADGEVLFWLHDISLEGANVYQYRVRLALVNPVVSFRGDVEDPQDAVPAVVRTDFSEWSNPIYAPRDTEFYVTGKNVTQGYASVTVFRRSLGQYVSKKFNVVEGEMIGGQAKSMKLMNPEDGTQVRKNLDFATGSVVVHMDFAKTVTRKGSVPAQTVELHYLDEEGVLRTRIGHVDKNSTRYKWLKDEVERAKAAARG